MIKKNLTPIFAAIALMAATAACSSDDNLEAVDTTARVTWDGRTALLATDSLWCTTRYNNRLALTNYANHLQYVIDWDGNSSDGPKSNGRLRVSKVGQRLLTYALGTLTVKDIAGQYYQIDFSFGNKQGQIVVEK